MSTTTTGFVAHAPLSAATGARGALSSAAARSAAQPRMAAGPSQQPAAYSRRAMLGLSAAALSALAVPLDRASAGAVRRASRMTGEYKADAAHLLEDMKEATDLVRGSPNMAEVVGRTREDMTDFVALYRRNDKVAGSASYSVLYTASNTLSGHYASYGPLYPVPEKRKKRLQQQFSEIERALSRGR